MGRQSRPHAECASEETGPVAESAQCNARLTVRHGDPLTCAVCCVLTLTASGDEAGAEELRKELLKAKAKMIAAMQRQAGEWCALTPYTASFSYCCSLVELVGLHCVAAAAAASKSRVLVSLCQEAQIAAADGRAV